MSDACLYLLPGLICSDYVWHSQVEAFAGHQVFAVPGYGDADSIPAMARQVLESAPPRLAVAGHSMGARVALEMWRLAPQRIERIALLDTGVHAVRPGEFEKRMALLDTGRRRGMAALVADWLPPMVHPRRRQDAHFMRPLFEMALSAGLDGFERQVLALLSRPDASLLLPDIDVPALVAVGREDEWSPVAQHETIARAIRGAELVVFDDAGHMSPLEVPAQVSQALFEWLNR